MDPLRSYRDKRTFDQTPEPSGDLSADAAFSAGSAAQPHFVIQKHDARRLHYDVRLEADGVLISWAVPKGPSYDPKVKRLAVHVEDHPLDYQHFEGVIPGAQYGAGTVIVWDEGSYRNLTTRNGHPVAVTDAVNAGHVSVWLEGVKLRGGWSLTRTHGGDKETWIMVKRADDRAQTGFDVETAAPDSVRSARSLAEVGADRDAARWTRGQATWRAPMLAQPVRAADHRAGDLRAGGSSESRAGGSSDPGWHYERKLDGLRCVAVRNGDQVELWSRNHLSFTARFPDVVEALRGLAVDNFTLDGELVAFEGTQTSFSRLQRPNAATPPKYCVFDLLHLLGRDTTELALADRRALLQQLLEGAPELLSLVEGLEGDRQALIQRACDQGWEGLIAKRIGSTYHSGRSVDWQKIKCSASQDLVIGGWTDSSSARRGFGALLLGYYDETNRDLHFAGKVGTGFDEATLRDVHAALVALQVSESPFAEPVPFKGVHWAAPELVASVTFSEWTADGRLRHPSFQGLRPDKPAGSVRRQSPG